MRSFLKIILLIFPVALFAQSDQKIVPNGYNTFYYDNGKVSSEGTMLDGKPEGYWKTYSSNGTIKSEGNRKNFQLDSIWKFYNEQGQLAFEYNYKEGKKNGTRKTFDTKEKFLITSENFQNDIKQGNTILYYKPSKPNEPEKVKQITPFVNGKEEGIAFELTVPSLLSLNTKWGLFKKKKR